MTTALHAAVVNQTRVMLANIAAQTATFNGTNTDVTSYEGVLACTQIVGTVSGTTPTLDGKVETSDTSGSGYVSVPTTSGASAATYTQVTASNNVQTVFIDKRACKKFIRYTGTIGGTTPSFTMGVLLTTVAKYQ